MRFLTWSFLFLWFTATVTLVIYAVLCSIVGEWLRAVGDAMLCLLTAHWTRLQMQRVEQLAREPEPPEVPR